MFTRYLTRTIDASIRSGNGSCSSTMNSINTIHVPTLPSSLTTTIRSSFSFPSSTSSIVTTATVRSFHSSCSAYKVTSLRNEIKRTATLNYAPLENLVQPSTGTVPHLEEKVDQARYAIFGTIKGNGQRTGRKRLRKALRGSSIKAWYGHHLNDILPETLFPIKEDYYRMEIALQRLGKSRITGKIKQPLKATVDQLTFEDAIPDILEKVDEVSYRELLLSNEIIELEQALNNVTTKEERNFIENSYRRIALDRSQRPDAWIEYMDKVEKEASGGAATSAPAEDDKGSGSKKRVNTFEFRQGLTDKRQWGRGMTNNKENDDSKKTSTAATTPAEGTAPSEGEKKNDSPAATAEAPGVVATAGKTETSTAESEAKPVTESGTAASTSTTATSTESSTPAAASTTVETMVAPEVYHLRIFQSSSDGKDGKVIVTSGEEFNQQYSEYIQAVATDTWNSISKYKDSMERGVLYRDMERALRSQGYDVSLEGMTKLLTNDSELRTFVTRSLEASSQHQQTSRQASMNASNEVTDLRSTVRKRETTGYDRRTGGSSSSTGDRRKPTRR